MKNKTSSGGKWTVNIFISINWIFQSGFSSIKLPAASPLMAASRCSSGTVRLPKRFPWRMGLVRVGWGDWGGRREGCISCRTNVSGVTQVVCVCGGTLIHSVCVQMPWCLQAPDHITFFQELCQCMCVEACVGNTLTWLNSSLVRPR